MSDRQTLLHRRLDSADFGPEPDSALDYLQLRNLEALRAWRARYVASFSSTPFEAHGTSQPLIRSPNRPLNP